MGLGYVDSIVLYNRYESGVLGNVFYIGTRFDNVRVELTQGANIRTSGIENADSCVVKISNNMTLPKTYVAPVQWLDLTTEEMQEKFTLDKDNKNFWVIAKKEELGINIEPPEGLIDGSDYQEGFLEHISREYGYTYMLNTVDVYTLIPRFEIGGS